MKKNNVLNRRLFRHKAQIATKQVPGYVLGFLAQPALALGRFAAPYAARAIGPVTRFGRKGIDAFAQRFPKTAQVTKEVGTGAGKAAEIAGMGYTATEGIGAGIDASQAVGKLIMGDIQGAEKEAGDAVSGLLSASIGLPFAQRGAQITKRGLDRALGRDGESGIGNLFEKFARFDKVTPDVVKRNPIKSSLAAAGGSTAFELSRPSSIEASENVSKVLSEPLNQEELDIVPASGDVDQSVLNTDDQGENKDTILFDTQARENLNKELKEIKNQKTDDGGQKQFTPGGGIQGAFDENKSLQNVTENLIKNSNNPTGNTKVVLSGGGGVDTTETDLSTTTQEIGKMSGDMSKAEALIEKFAKSRMEKTKQTPEEFKEQFYGMAGSPDTKRMKDYAILKAALGLMSEPTYDGGLAGAFEVVGRVGGRFVDDLAAIDQNARNERLALSEKYMEYERAFDDQMNADEALVFSTSLDLINKIDKREFDAEQKSLDRALEREKMLSNALINAEKARIKMQEKKFKVNEKGIYLVPDSNVFGQLKKVTVYTNELNEPLVQKIVKGEPRMVPLTNTEGTKIVPDNLQKVEYNANKAGRAFNQAASAYQGLLLARQFQNIIEKAGGKDLIALKGVFQRLKTTAFDVLDQVMPGASEKLNITNISKSINPNTTSDAQFKTELAKIAGRDQAEMNKILANYDKDIAAATDTAAIARRLEEAGIAKDDPEYREKVAALAQLNVIEARMKYNVANANKDGDRLALKDITEAEKITQIFKITGAGQIVAQYAALEQSLDQKLALLFEDFRNNGGDPEAFARAFADSKFVQRMSKQEKREIKVSPNEQARARDRIQGEFNFNPPFPKKQGLFN